MKKILGKLFTLSLALMCLFTCAFAEGDSVVATYNGGEVTMSEIELSLQTETSMMQTTMSYLQGANYTVTDDDLKNLREAVITAQAKFEILLNKMAEMGLSDLTDEEKTLIRQNAEFYFLQYVYNYTMQGMSADEATYILSAQGVTPDILYDNTYKNAIIEKIIEALEIDETISDEEIAQKYDSLTADHEKAYANAPESAESLVNGGKPLYFIPENMKYIKHIILMPEDEALSDELDAAVNQLMTYEYEYQIITSPTYQKRYDDIVEKAIRDECVENIEISKKALEEVKAKVFEAVKPEVDKILDLIENGESFDALIEEYSHDPGSKKEPVKTNGYLVYMNSESWDGAFIEAAKALENVGDVSEAVVGDLGVYIVKFESQPVSGKAALENVKDHITQEILNKRRNEAFSSQAEAWYAEADIQLNPDAF